MAKPKNNILVIIIFILIFLVLGIFFFKAQKKENLPLADITNATNHSCTSFNVGFKILSLNYTNSKNELKQKTVAMWYPTDEAEKEYKYLMIKGSNAQNAKISSCGKFPLIMFSHGYTGCGIQSIFLTEELARNGYIVIAPDHYDSLCSSMPGKGSSLEDFDLSQFNHPEEWSDKTYLDRKEDILFALDYALAENSKQGSFFYNSVDKDSIGIMGHSLGGYTSLGLIGAWPSWQDNRFKAALLLSPVIKPYLLHDNLKSIDIPVMIQGGTLDSTITPSIPQVYSQLSEPKYFLNIKFASHLAWANMGCAAASSARNCLQSNERVQAIDYYAITFFDKYLKEDPSADNKLKQKKDVLESYEFEM